MTARPVLLLIALLSAAVLAQSRPESSPTRPESSPTRPDTASTRPSRKLAVRRLPFPIKGEGSVPSACSFSPDGRFLAAARGYYGYDFNVYDLKRGELVHTAHAKPDLANDPCWANWPPAFNSKSDRLAFTVDRGVSFLDLVEGQWRPAMTVPLPFKPWVMFPNPRTIAWSPDEAVMLFTEGEAYRLALPSGETSKLDCGAGRPIEAHFLGKLFAVTSALEGGYETALLSGNEVVERLPGVGILACSADKSSWVVARRAPIAGAESAPGSRPAIEIWDGPERRARALLTIREDAFDPLKKGICHAVFSADGRLLVTGDFRLVDIRDGRTGAILHTIRYYEGDRIVALAISPDGRHLLTMGRPTNREDDGIVLWELTFE